MIKEEASWRKGGPKPGQAMADFATVVMCRDLLSRKERDTARTEAVRYRDVAKRYTRDIGPFPWELP